MPPVPAAEEEQHYAAVIEDILGYQENTKVVFLGNFNARVGSATTNFDVIGKSGETHRNASGQRLIHLLHGTSMYALNGRHPCLHPAWTRCRMSRSEQSILDYVMVGTDYFSRAPHVQVLQADVSDH
jgi:endonuclease/exonuclease/phosphatase family metal-dependent hydrolase